LGLEKVVDGEIGGNNGDCGRVGDRRLGLAFTWKGIVVGPEFYIVNDLFKLVEDCVVEVFY
jgi:hypothetical protein